MYHTPTVRHCEKSRLIHNNLSKNRYKNLWSSINKTKKIEICSQRGSHKMYSRWINIEIIGVLDRPNCSTPKLKGGRMLMEMEALVDSLPNMELAAGKCRLCDYQTSRRIAFLYAHYHFVQVFCPYTYRSAIRNSVSSYQCVNSSILSMVEPREQ